MGVRSKARKRAIDILYEADLRELDPVTLVSERLGSTDPAPVQEYAVALIEGISAHRPRIDDVLVEHAEGWTLSRMPVVDRAVLRLGLFELFWGVDVPPAVAIDQAVELVKALSTDDSPRFVNGVLGRIAGISDQLREGMADREHSQDEVSEAEPPSGSSVEPAEFANGAQQRESEQPGAEHGAE